MLCTRSRCDTVLLITHTSLLDLNSIPETVPVMFAVSATPWLKLAAPRRHVEVKTWKSNKRVALRAPFLWIFHFQQINHQSMWHDPLSPHHTNPMKPLHLPVCVHVFLLRALTLRRFPTSPQEAGIYLYTSSNVPPHPPQLPKAAALCDNADKHPHDGPDLIF